MISVMFGSASSASSGPRPRTSSGTDSTRRSLSFLVIVIAVERKYSSASSKIFSLTQALLLESISSANFSIRRAWICTLAAVKAGVTSPAPADAARCESDDGGGLVAADCAAGMAACGVYGVEPGKVAVVGPLPAPLGGTVWFCLTLSSRPIRPPGYRAVKWYFASTWFWLTPPARVISGHAASWLSAGG